MCATIDNKQLLTGDSKGIVKQWQIYGQSLIKSYGKIHEGWICSMTISTDNQFLFTSDDTGVLKKWNLEKHVLVKDYNQIDSGIYSIACTLDNKYLFTSDLYGIVKQWSITRETLYHNYGKVHECDVFSICVSNDSKYLYTSGGKNGEVKCFDINTYEELNHYKGFYDCVCNGIGVTYDDKFLFTSDNFGYVHQLDLGKGTVMEEWGKVHDCEIVAIALTKVHFKQKGNQSTKRFYQFSKSNQNYKNKKTCKKYELDNDAWKNSKVVIENSDFLHGSGDTPNLPKSKFVSSDSNLKNDEQNPNEIEINVEKDTNQKSKFSNLSEPNLKNNEQNPNEIEINDEEGTNKNPV